MNIDALPYVPAAHQSARPAGVAIDLIVVHTAETGEGATAAEGVANYFASGGTTGSAHVITDVDSAVRSVPDARRANGAGGVNANGLHLEQAGRAGQHAAEWADPYSSAMLELSAEVVRQWIVRHPNIKPVRLYPADLARGARNGICGHDDVTKAGFAGNDGHWDPGPEFPWSGFLAMVAGSAPLPPIPETRKAPTMLLCTPDGISTFLRDEDGLLTNLSDSSTADFKDKAVELRLVDDHVPNAELIPKRVWDGWVVIDAAKRKALGLELVDGVWLPVTP